MTITPSPEEFRLLNVIASTEAPAYDVMYGHGWSGEDRRFDDYTSHPGKYWDIVSGPNKGLKSSAAGRYQFLESTWNSLADRYDLPDFSPTSQDLGAVALAREDYARKTGRNLTEDLASGDPSTLALVGETLSSTWTSLPSGIEEGQDTDQFVAAFGAADPNTNVALSEAMTAASTAGASMSTDLADMRAAQPPTPAPHLEREEAGRSRPAPLNLIPFDLRGLVRKRGA